MDIKNYRGLNTEQVAESRKKYGSNKMTRKKRRGFFAEYLSNLGDPVVRVLLISLAVNIIFTLRDVDWFEVGGIVIAIVLSTTISTLSERSSHAAFERLNGASKRLCRVVRLRSFMMIIRKHLEALQSGKPKQKSSGLKSVSFLMMLMKKL